MQSLFSELWSTFHLNNVSQLPIANQVAVKPIIQLLQDMPFVAEFVKLSNFIFVSSPVLLQCVSHCYYILYNIYYLTHCIILIDSASMRFHNGGSLLIRTLVRTLHRHGCHRDLADLFDIVSNFL